jgi:pre-mRNA-splicing factor SYF1
LFWKTNNFLSSTDVNFIASQAIARSQQQRAQENGEADMGDEEADKEQADAMAALERQARAPVGFVAASTGPEGGNRPSGAQQPAPPANVNPDAIDLDDDEDMNE